MRVARADSWRSKGGNVCFGSLADIRLARINVRLVPYADIAAAPNAARGAPGLLPEF